MKKLIELKNLTKIYGKGRTELKVLSHINIVISKGEFVAIMGPSGSGKSTLLNIIGCLDKLTKGKYILDDKEVAKSTSQKILAKIRREKIGFIFQSFHLIPRTSALNNVMLPAVYSGLPNRKQAAIELLKKVGLSSRIKHIPSELSGGEQQRVAIARSLINKPEIILADEPTGNLDSKVGLEIMKILKELNSDGATIIMVTHDIKVGKMADRIIHIEDGKIAK